MIKIDSNDNAVTENINLDGIFFEIKYILRYIEIIFEKYVFYGIMWIVISYFTN